MAVNTENLLIKPSREEIERMTFDEMVTRKAFAYKAAVANGTNAERLLSGLYKDPTHFIYELLQNAEDAGATEVRMVLDEDKLVFAHNGRPFNNRDTWAVLSIDESPKNDSDNESLTQIGRFGIGFKSVFGICDTPEIYSKDFCFSIHNFYVPERKERPSDYEQDKTYIALHFKKSEIKNIFQIIEEALSILNPDTILFLRSIEKIDYSTPKYSSFFEKKKNKRNCDSYEYYECDILGRQGLVAKYYVFEKPLKKNNKLISSIAYKVDKENKRIIAEQESTKLVVFFPTEKDTFLRFKVNGPYQTTPTRESVPETADNLEILNETAELYKGSLLCLKSLGFITVEFLSLLPLKSRKQTLYHQINGTYQPYTKTDSVFYEAFYNVTVEAFSKEELLPTLKNNFTTANKALLAYGGATGTRGETIVDLLSEELNTQVFGDRTIWLSTAITENRTPELRIFIISVLKIKEIGFDEFLSTVKAEFLERQPNEWLIRFYTIGNRNIQTLKEKHLNKPIIKTESGKMVAAQDNKKPNVYIASKLTKNPDKIVNSMLLKNEEVKKFFYNIGIEEMSIVESIRTQWLPSIIKTKDENNNTDELELLYLEYNDQNFAVQMEIRTLLKESECILYRDNTGNACYSKASDFFMAHGLSKTLYDGCPNIRFINDALNTRAENDNGFFNFLVKLGVCSNVKFIELENQLSHEDDEEFLRITKNASASYSKYEDISVQIFEINYILENINKGRSRALWQVINNTGEEQFKGTISWSVRTKKFNEPYTAHFVRTLREAKWLYAAGSDAPVAPHEIYQEDAEKEYGRSSLIGKYFQFLPDAARQLPQEDQEKLKLARQIPIEKLQELYDGLNAISETPEIVDVKPEETPIEIQIADFNNSYKEMTSDELVQNDNNADAESSLSGMIDDLYNNADIPDTIKEKIAIKRVTNEADIDGDLGERFVVSSLKKEYIQDGYSITNDETNSFSATKDGKTIDVIRQNTGHKNQRGFDITKAERGIVFEWIEVKAKKDDNPKLFKVSGLQWEFAKKKYVEGDGNKHWVYVVTSVREPQKTKITKTPNPYKAWLDGDLKANPVNIEY